MAGTEQGQHWGSGVAGHCESSFEDTLTGMYVCVCVCVCVCANVSAQSCPTLCDPMNCSRPGPSVHGIFQARTLEWVAISSSNPHRSLCFNHIQPPCFSTQDVNFQ